MNDSCTALIILNYNNFEDTINCIDSIEQFNTAPIKYFVVDNASPRDGVIIALDKFFINRFNEHYIRIESTSPSMSNYPYVTFITSKENNGYAQGNNIGLKFAFSDKTIDSIMILNNDVLFVDDIIQKLNFYTNTLPNCGLVSPLLYKREMKGIDYNCARRNQTSIQMLLRYLLFDKSWLGVKQRIWNWQYFLKKDETLLKKIYIPIELPSGSCMLATKKTWQKIKGFDPNTFLYYEEPILYKKLQKIHKQNYLIPSLKCIHLGGESISKSKSPEQKLRAFKSTKYYAKKYASDNLFMRLILTFVMKINEFVLKINCLIN